MPKPETRFPRSARLTSARAYTQVFEQARRYGAPALTVLVRGNRMPQARLGLVISRKCARSAVARNRIKRLIRESFRREKSRLPGLDIVVIGRPTITNRTNQQIYDDLANLWKRITPCDEQFSS